MKIEGKMMQFMTGSKAEATEEGAEGQEDDVATLEMMSRHHDQELKTVADEKRCRDKRSDVATSGTTSENSKRL